MEKTCVKMPKRCGIVLRFKWKLNWKTFHCAWPNILLRTAMYMFVSCVSSAKYYVFLQLIANNGRAGRMSWVPEQNSVCERLAPASVSLCFGSHRACYTKSLLSVKCSGGNHVLHVVLCAGFTWKLMSVNFLVCACMVETLCEATLLLSETQ